MERYRELCSANPGFHTEVTDSHVIQSRGDPVATVFTVIRNSGMPNDGESKSTCTWTWERREGRWMCVRTASMHGMSGTLNEM